MKYKNFNVLWFEDSNYVIVQGKSNKEFLEFLEEFFIGDLEEIYEEVPKQEIIEEYDETDLSDLLDDYFDIRILLNNLMICGNRDEHSLDLEKLKESGITYSNLDDFLKEFVVVSFEEKEECLLCKKAIKEDDLKYLKELSDKDAYCYIFPENIVFEDGTGFAELLYNLKVTPMPDTEDSE